MERKRKRPSKLQVLLMDFIEFFIKIKMILIVVIVALLLIAVAYSIYITPKGYYDKPIELKPVVKGKK